MCYDRHRDEVGVGARRFLLAGSAGVATSLYLGVLPKSGLFVNFDTRLFMLFIYSHESDCLKDVIA